MPLMYCALYLLFNGKSALHIATTDNNVDAIKPLLLNGANVNAKDYGVSISIC